MKRTEQQVIAEISNALGGLKVLPIAAHGDGTLIVSIRAGQRAAAEERLKQVDTGEFTIQLDEVG